MGISLFYFTFHSEGQAYGIITSVRLYPQITLKPTSNEILYEHVPLEIFVFCNI